MSESINEQYPESGADEYVLSRQTALHEYFFATIEPTEQQIQEEAAAIRADLALRATDDPESPVRRGVLHNPEALYACKKTRLVVNATHEALIDEGLIPDPGYLADEKSEQQ